MFGAIPFGSFRAAVWCCPSMHFVVRFVSDGIECIPLRSARFRSLGVYIASNFVSFAGAGHVCAPFGRKQHVRQLLALGYDSLEYFIFYIL